MNNKSFIDKFIQNNLIILEDMLNHMKIKYNIQDDDFIKKYLNNHNYNKIKK